MTHRSHHMRSMYPLARRSASFILLAGLLVCTRSPAASESVLWTQAEHVAAGDDFLALGYPRGIALFGWNNAAPPAPSGQLSEPGLTALHACGSCLFWSRSDSTIRGARVGPGPIAVAWTSTFEGTVSEIGASERFVSAVVDFQTLHYWSRDDSSSAGRAWRPPGGRPLAAVALRDSTAMAGGGEWLWLLRLRPDTAILLDSVAPGSFVQAAAWAGDTLVMAFGASGLKLLDAGGDRFGDSVRNFSDGGIYNDLAVWNHGWAGLDLLGRVRMFARGGPLEPVATSETSGSLRSASGRGAEIAVLTLEFGLGILNAFTPQAPFWSVQLRLPGYVRSFEHSPVGMLAHADFAGVFALEDSGARWVMQNPFNALDLDVDGGLVAATGLLSGAALFELQRDSLASPASSVPIDGFAAAAELVGVQLYAVSSAACNLGFSVYDVSDPKQPTVVTRWSTCAPVRDIEKVPGALAVALGDSGIWMYAIPITDSTAPIARSPERKAWRQLAWRDDRLYSRAADGTLARWQWNGLTLVELDRVVVPGLTGFDAEGGRLALATDVPGIQIQRWPEGSPPVFAEHVASLYPPGRVAVVADTLWFVDRDAVIRTLLQPTSGVNEPGDPLRPEEFAFFPPFPNPFNGNLEIPLALRPGEWNVSIYNILGQRVHGWQGWTPVALGTALRWDPRGAAGTSLAAGVYLIKAQSAEMEITRKVTFLK